MKIKSMTRCALFPLCAVVLIVTWCMICLTGCKTTAAYSEPTAAASVQATNEIVLRETDVLKITFPSAENLDTVQTIRRDGKITLQLVGEVVAAGKTPTELQKELVGLYSKELVSAKDIIVAVQSSSFPIFVTGAVQRPGKVLCDHPMTALEGIMESGGFDYTRANLKAVKVLRIKNGQTHSFTLNLKGVLNGTAVTEFYLQPSDIIFVPEKFTWF